MWEPGLPAMAVYQLMYWMTDTPPSRASPAPTFYLWRALYDVRLTTWQHGLGQVINHGLPHLTQIMRRPRILLATHIQGIVVDGPLIRKLHLLRYPIISGRSCHSLLL
jgi:hypothetical protein